MYSMKNNLKAITSKITIQAEKWTLLAPQMPLYTFPWLLPPPFPRNNDYIFVIIMLIFFVVLLSTYESLNNIIISCSQILYMYIQLSCNTLLCLTSFVQCYALRFIHIVIGVLYFIVELCHLYLPILLLVYCTFSRVSLGYIQSSGTTGL